MPQRLVHGARSLTSPKDRSAPGRNRRDGGRICRRGEWRPGSIGAEVPFVSMACERGRRWSAACSPFRRSAGVRPAREDHKNKNDWVSPWTCWRSRSGRAPLRAHPWLRPMARRRASLPRWPPRARMRLLRAAPPTRERKGTQRARQAHSPSLSRPRAPRRSSPHPPPNPPRPPEPQARAQSSPRRRPAPRRRRPTPLSPSQELLLALRLRPPQPPSARPLHRQPPRPPSPNQPLRPSQHSQPQRSLPRLGARHWPLATPAWPPKPLCAPLRRMRARPARSPKALRPSPRQRPPRAKPRPALAQPPCAPQSRATRSRSSPPPKSPPPPPRTRRAHQPSSLRRPPRAVRAPPRPRRAPPRRPS